MNLIDRINLHFTTATITAIIGAALAVAVSFGAHLSQAQTHSILVLVGLLAAAVTIGGGAKTGGMIRAGFSAGRFHFTGATIVSAVGAAIAVAAAFGLHLAPENRSSLLELVGLLAGGVTVGGGIKSAAMLAAGVHPLQTQYRAQPIVGRAVESIREGEHGFVRLDTTSEGDPFTAEELNHIVGRGTLHLEHPRRRRFDPRHDDGTHPILKVHGTFAGLALGKHLQVKTDARTPVLGEFLAATTKMKLPAAVARIQEVAAELGGDFGMMGNDVHGDCTCAGMGHALQFWTGFHGAPVTPNTDAVLSLYWSTGSPPTPGADDNGRVMFDVLKYAHTNGLFGHELGAYVGVGLRRYHNRDIKAAVDLFGGCYLGVALPETAQSQAVWDVAGDPHASGPAQAGSWGGHAIWAADYDKDGLTVITWGHPQKMTWAFLDAYGDEAYAVISPDWLRGGKTVEGFDLAALTAYLAKIKSWQPPGS